MLQHARPHHPHAATESVPDELFFILTASLEAAPREGAPRRHGGLWRLHLAPVGCQHPMPRVGPTLGHTTASTAPPADQVLPPCDTPRDVVCALWPLAPAGSNTCPPTRQHCNPQHLPEPAPGVSTVMVAWRNSPPAAGCRCASPIDYTRGRHTPRRGFLRDRMPARACLLPPIIEA